MTQHYELLTHEPSWEGGVSPHFPIDFDQTLFNDPLHLISGECILKPVTEHHYKGQTFSQLMRTR